MKKILSTVRNKKGASLLVVTVIFAILIIMGTSLITVSSANYHNSVSYHYQKQSYYTAKSALDMVVTAFNTKDQCIALMNQLQTDPVLTNDKSTSTPIAGLGSYDIRIEKVIPATPNAKKEIKLEVKGEYKDKGTLLKATLKEGKGDHINPVEFVFFAKDDGLKRNSISSGRIDIVGDVLSRGTVDLEDAYVEGNFLNIGGIELRNSNVKGKLIVDISLSGNIVLKPNTKIKGDFYTTTGSSLYDTANFPKDALEPQLNKTDPTKMAEHFRIPAMKLGINSNFMDHFKVTGQNFFDRDTRLNKIHFSNGIEYNFIDKFICFPDGSEIGMSRDLEYTRAKKPKDSLTESPKVTIPRSDLTTDYKFYDNKATINFSARTLTMDDDGFEINTKDNIVTIKDASGNVKGKIYLDANKFYNATGVEYDLNDVYIDSDGTYRIKSALTSYTSITSSTPPITDDCFFNLSDIVNANFTVDTSVNNKDINIYCPRGLVFDSSNMQIKGDHNVYMYLEDAKQLNLIGTSEVGFNNHNETQLYVIGKDNKMQINNKARFKGVAYLDGQYSKFNHQTLSSISSERILGSITAREIIISGGEKYRYVEPFKEPKFYTTLRKDAFYIYPPLEPGQINWRVTYG